jgi:hypothetical protein
LDGTELTAVSAQHFLDLPRHVFLILEQGLPKRATPVVRFVGSIQETVGNVVTAGEVTASDGIGLTGFAVPSLSQWALLAMAAALAVAVRFRLRVTTVRRPVWRVGWHLLRRQGRARLLVWDSVNGRLSGAASTSKGQEDTWPNSMDRSL